MDEPHETPHLTLRFLAEPSTVNFGGKVHGGVVMKWIDEAGYACASRWARRYCVAAYVSGISFLRPIPVGHLVEVRARLVLTGRSSLHVVCEVASAPLAERELALTARCLIVFVALGEDGKPTAVPEWQPAGTDDEAWAAYARRAMQARQHIEGTSGSLA
jgi:acyl-CoA hydrolase